MAELHFATGVCRPRRFLKKSMESYCIYHYDPNPFMHKTPVIPWSGFAPVRCNNLFVFTECFFWSYRKSWALLLIVSKPLSITWKYSVIGAVLIFSYSSLLKQLFLWLNTFSCMTRSMSAEDGANSSSKQSNPRKYLEEEYLQTEKKVILLTILALLTDDKHALLIEENRDFSYNRHHRPWLPKDF